MKRDITLWQFGGFAFTSFFGTILHFLYDWTGENVFSAFISAVNESTWEHMKLFFFSAFAFALIQSFFFKDSRNFWCIKLIGILTGIGMIPFLFYMYNGVIGKSPDWVNIAIFFVSAAVSYWAESRLLKKDLFKCQSQKIAFLIICFIALLFVLLTFLTPRIALFKDPLTSTYGYFERL